MRLNVLNALLFLVSLSGLGLSVLGIIGVTYKGYSSKILCWLRWYQLCRRGSHWPTRETTEKRSDGYYMVCERCGASSGPLGPDRPTPPWSTSRGPR